MSSYTRTVMEATSSSKVDGAGRTMRQCGGRARRSLGSTSSVARWVSHRVKRPPRLLVERLPPQIETNALEMVCLGGQPLGHLTKEHQREIKLPGEIIRDRDGGSDRLGRKRP